MFIFCSHSIWFSDLSVRLRLPFWQVVLETERTRAIRLTENLIALYFYNNSNNVAILLPTRTITRQKPLVYALFGGLGVMVRSRLSSFGAKSSILTVFPSFAFVLPPLATFPHAIAARKTARYVPSTLLTPFSFTPLRSPPSRTLSRLRRRLASVSSLSFVSLSP